MCVSLLIVGHSFFFLLLVIIFLRCNIRGKTNTCFFNINIYIHTYIFINIYIYIFIYIQSTRIGLRFRIGLNGTAENWRNRMTKKKRRKKNIVKKIITLTREIYLRFLNCTAVKMMAFRLFHLICLLNDIQMQSNTWINSLLLTSVENSYLYKYMMAFRLFRLLGRKSAPDLCVFIISLSSLRKGTQTKIPNKPLLMRGYIYIYMCAFVK